MCPQPSDEIVDLDLHGWKVALPFNNVEGWCRTDNKTMVENRLPWDLAPHDCEG